MTNSKQSLLSPIDCIIFDCDGTLTAIEGIDALAEKNGVSQEVSALTAYAMGQAGINPDIYQQRLGLVRPTSSQVQQLAETIFCGAYSRCC